jgi:hypothetical protein
MLSFLALMIFATLAVGAVVIGPADKKQTILLTPREAAEELRISEKHLYNQSEPRGPIRKIVIGERCVRYDREQLREDVLKMNGQNQVETA